jgi:hypothetical protein
MFSGTIPPVLAKRDFESLFKFCYVGRVGLEPTDGDGTTGPVIRAEMNNP